MGTPARACENHILKHTVSLQPARQLRSERLVADWQNAKKIDYKRMVFWLENPHVLLGHFGRKRVTLLTVQCAA